MHLNAKRNVGKLKGLFLKKCQLQKSEQLIYLDFTYQRFTEIKSKCPNENVVQEDISRWAQEIEDEIRVTFEHLENEIQTTYLPGGSNDYSHYCVQSLLNYLKWRLKNSEEIILQKTIILSRKINDQIPHPCQIELPCLKCYPPSPKKYNYLESFRVGNRLKKVDKYDIESTYRSMFLKC